MEHIKATNALFIKLGGRGDWEKKCIDSGIIRLGYNELDHQACLDNDWDRVRKQYSVDSDPGAITRHVNQVKKFYTEPEDTLWITFYSDRLWWCFAKPEITLYEGGSKIRRTVNGWNDSNIKGEKLIKNILSGKLLAVQSFQGTICTVKANKYLLNKINGITESYITEAEEASHKLQNALVPIIKNLHPKDLETLTDLIFRQVGWQRTSVEGGVEKDIDLSLQSPLTSERVAVQVKSKSSFKTYNTYKQILDKMETYSTFYYVVHSPDKKLAGYIAENRENYLTEGNQVLIKFWDADDLAMHAVRNGLVSWLIDRAC